MKNKGINRDTLFGVASVFISIAVTVLWIVACVVSIVSGTGYYILVIISGNAFCILCLYAAMKAFMRVSRYKKYSAAIGKSGRFRIPALAATLKKDSVIMCGDLYGMVKAGYFGDNAEIDSETKELIIDKNSEPSNIPKSETETVYKHDNRFSLFPLIAGGSVLLLCLAAGAFSPPSFISGGIIGLTVFVSAVYFFPKNHHFKETERAPHKPKSVVKTGNEELDGFLAVSSNSENELRRIDAAIEDTPFRGTVRELTRILGEITEHVTEYPEKIKLLRQFSTYYLPTTIRLAQNYEELHSVSDKGQNVNESIRKIEAMGGKVVGVFKNEYDMLFGDKAMDISAEISVMESMIEQSATGESPFSG